MICKLGKLVHEWIFHLEIFSRPQAKENFLGYLCFFEQKFYRKHLLGAPEWSLLNQLIHQPLLSLDLQKHYCIELLGREA